MIKITKDVATVRLPKTALVTARRFAKERTKDNALYQKRGGFKVEDIVSGALAEIAVHKLLKEKGIKVSPPDFEIYEKGRKSYDADLTDGHHHFHVKGQTLESKKRYGASWIMQRKDPIINKPENCHYLVPCTVCIETGRVDIYGLMSIKTLVDNACIQECKLEWFRKTKVALYMEYIEGILTTKARWGALYKIPERMKNV